MKLSITVLLVFTLGFFGILSGQQDLNLAGSHLDYWGRIQSIHLSDRTAYISTENLGLLTYDLENLSQPVRLNRSRQFRLGMLGEWNGYLTGVTSGHLVFIDTSNPDDPQLVARIEAQNVVSYCFSDTLCFISTFYAVYRGGPGDGRDDYTSISIYNVNDLRNTNLRYRQEFISYRDTTYTGFGEMVYHQGYLYTAYVESGLTRVWDTGNADTLVLATELDSYGSQGLTIQQGHLFNIKSRSVTKYRLDDPASPDSTGALQFDYSGVFIQDTLLYRLNYPDSTLRIIDITDFDHPNQIGQLQFPVRPSTWFVVSDDAGIILTSESAKAEIIDLTDLSSPELSCVIGEPKSIAEVWKFSDLLFSYVDGEGLIISDCTERARPVEVALLPLPTVTSVVMKEYLAFIAVRDSVFIYDVSEPTEPERITSIVPRIDWIRDVEECGNALYIASRIGLNLYDISNLRSPSHVSTLREGDVAELQIVGTLLLARESVTASVFSINNPLAPRLIAPYERENRERDQAIGMLVIDRTLFVFRIFNPSEDEYPPILDVVDISRPDSARLIWTHYSGGFEAQFGSPVNINGRLGMVYQDALYIYSLNSFHNYGPPCYAWYRLQPYSRGPAIIDGDYIYVTTPGSIDIYDARPLGISNERTAPPSKMELLSLYPSPFNSSTTITFGLDKSASTRLAVFDLQGRMIAELAKGKLAQGEHRVIWNAEGLPAGIYLIRLEDTAGRSVTRKAVLMK